MSRRSSSFEIKESSFDKVIIIGNAKIMSIEPKADTQSIIPLQEAETISPHGYSRRKGS